jgi:hypothetical protein
MDEADGKPDKHDATSQMEGARLRVIVAFAYCFWCHRQLRDLVDSFHSFDASSAWLASFSQLRRAARDAEFSGSLRSTISNTSSKRRLRVWADGSIDGEATLRRIECQRSW